MIELSILKAFCSSKQTYLRYNKYINTSYIKQNFVYIHKIYNVIEIIYTKYPNESIRREELESLFITYYPVLKDTERKELSSLLDRIFDSVISDDILSTLFETHKNRALAAELAIVSLRVAEGKEGPEAIRKAYKAFDQTDEGIEVPFVTSDLEALYGATAALGGIYWPLPCLNKSIGPLRKGNFGFVFARPEVGKTTFLSQFVTNAVRNVDKPIIWFNNEQPGEEVMIRLYQAAFGVTTSELFSNRKKYNDLYKSLTKDLLFLVDDAIIGRSTIESLLKQHGPSLVVFDQIDKIKGFEDDRYDLELGQRYQWARELAKEYCPVIGVCQADASGENVKYLTMTNVANAKTSKQAEADWILGIGATQSDDFKLYRYLNISKNKLLGDENTDPGLRRGQFQVIIEPEIARYREV